MSEHHDHDAPLPDTVLRVKALESLLTEKGLVDPQFTTLVKIANGLGVKLKDLMDI